MKLNWNLIIAMLLLTIMVIGLVFVLKHKSDECLKNPLVYASKMYTEQYGYEFHGYAWFDTPINKVAPKVTFNSTTLSIS